MRIGIAGPITLSLLADHLTPESAAISTYSFPYISQLALEYIRAGHSVDIFTSSTDAHELTVIDEGKIRLFIGRRRQSARARGLDFFKVERDDIEKAINLARPDVIHAHWTYEFASAALTVQPDSLVTAHDSPQALVRYYHHPYWWLRAALGIVTIRKAENVTVVSPTLSRQIELFTRRSVESSVVPNGISITCGDEKKVAGDDSRRKPDKNAPVFACIANGFDARKNTAAALQAFAEARKRLPNAQLLMCGTDHEPDGQAHTWAGSRDCTTNVQFLGPVSHHTILKMLDNEIDVLLHTSVWEACSLAILEAQHRGVPVIGGDRSGGVPYTLDYGGAGVLTDISSPDKLSFAMVNLIENTSSYERISAASISNIGRRFSFEMVSKTYLDMLEKIFNKREQLREPVT
ncbi:MAG: glycosyltransferase family 4 protein [Rhodococcus sp.]|nr:glycosyltransferase family 4 protein [Rhodococcus sp. (in: high G+C Gram-positive bacteria)]MBJ7323345.1 glycosyltransferase family 4 protein [Rhodococcus sp. (in: high G+C Gram-positive bacteria)]